MSKQPIPKNTISIDRESITIAPCENPRYVKVKEVSFRENGRDRKWEVALTHDSVSALIINEKAQEFIFVKQFRLPVYLNNNNGYTYELCAGIVDKDKSLEQIIKEEIQEECGYDVPLENIQEMMHFYSAVGFAGAKQTIFFAFIDETMKVSQGGGIDEENIEVIAIPIARAYDFLSDETVSTTPSAMYALLEYFRRQHNK